jgi:hypothetical protein
MFDDVIFAHGKVDWTHKHGDRLVWVGRLVDGRKFRIVHTNPVHALSLNVYNARLWLCRGKRRKLLKTVTN